jgi:hypothetical protein
MPLAEFQNDVAREPVGHDDVDEPLRHVAPLDESGVGKACRRETGVRLAQHLRALGVFRAVGQQPDRRPCPPEVDLRERSAHVRELDEVGAAALDVRPGVEQHDGGAGRGHDGSDGRPVAPGKALQRQRGDGQHRAAVAGGEEAGRFAVSHAAEPDVQRCPPTRPCDTRRRFVVTDGVRRVDDLDGGRRNPATLEFSAYEARVAHERQGSEPIFEREEGAGDHDGRTVIATHGVHGNRQRTRLDGHRRSGRQRRSGLDLFGLENVAVVVPAARTADAVGLLGRGALLALVEDGRADLVSRATHVPAWNGTSVSWVLPRKDLRKG